MFDSNIILRERRTVHLFQNGYTSSTVKFCGEVRLSMDKDLVTKGVQLVLDRNYWEAIELLLKELPNDNSEGEIASYIALSYY